MSNQRVFTSRNSDDTETYARSLGACLRGGEVIELVSDLGGGKTTFTRGLAAGMGSSNHVASPTFTISRQYGGANDLTLYHYDFYRLGDDAGLMADELTDTLADPAGVTVVEWSAAVRHVLPVKRLTVTIERTGESERRLTMRCPPELAYVLGETS